MSQQPEETVGLDLFDETASAAGSFPHSMLGYERQAVDAYIRDIERQLSSAKRKVRSLQKQIATATAETDVSKVGAHARDMLRAAEADAAEMRNRARIDADRIVAEATEQAELLSHGTQTEVAGHRVGSLEDLNRLRDELKQQTEAELAAARDEAQLLRDAAENHRRLVQADSERHATALREQAGLEADQVRQAAQREAAEVRAQVAQEHAAALDALQQHRAEVTALVGELAEKARLQSEQFGEALANDTALMNDRRLKSIAHADSIVADATERSKAIVAEARAAAAKREREAGLAEAAKVADLNEQISVLNQRASSLRKSLQSLSLMASEFAGDDQDDAKAAAQAATDVADVANDPIGQDEPTAEQPAVGDFDDTAVEAPLPVDDSDDDATRVQPAASGGGKRR